jgi:hypothetical protein
MGKENTRVETGYGDKVTGKMVKESDDYFCLILY